MKTKSNPLLRNCLAASAIAALSCGNTAFAAGYTWTKDSAATQTWTTTTNWTPNTVFVSGSGNTLTFFANTTTALASGNNNIITSVPAAFTLNSLTLNGLGAAATGATNVTIGTSASTWTLDGTNPSVNLNGLIGTQGLNYTVAANLTLAQANTNFAGNGTAGFTFPGTIGGASKGITKSGTSKLTLSGANSYTGGTTVNAGTLALQFVNGVNTSGVINSSSPLALGGCTLSLLGDATTANVDTQTFAGTTLSVSSSAISLAKGSATSVALDLGTLTNNKSYLNFTIGAGTSVTASHALDLSGALLGTWASVGSGTSLAYAASSNATSGNITSYAGATTATASTLADVTSATTNYKYSAAATVGGNLTGNTLQYTGGASSTDLGANTLTLNGLMNSGSGLLTISNTAGSNGIVIGASNELDITSNTQGITISSVISGASGALVYGGPSAGTLTLSGANTYGGGTYIVGTGPINASNSSAFGTGTVYLRSSQTSTGITLGISGGITVANAIEMDSTTGRENITSTGTGDNSLTGGMTITGVVNNALIINNNQTSGNLTLSGGITGATYTGSVSLRGSLSGAKGVFNGVVNINSNLQNNGTTDWIINSAGSSYIITQLINTGSFILGADNALATRARVAWNAITVTGALDLNGYSQSVAGLDANFAANTANKVTNNALSGGNNSTLTLAGLAADYTFGGVISDGANKTTALVMNSTGRTQTLKGTNTYTGGTTINAGTLSITSDGNLGGTSGGLTLNGGTLSMTGFTLNATRTLTVGSGNGTIINSSGGSAIFQGTVSGAGNTLTINNSSGGTFDLTGNVSLGTLTFAGTGNLWLSNNATITNAVTAGASQVLNLTSALDATVASYNNVGFSLNGGILRNRIGQNTLTTPITLAASSIIGNRATADALTFSGAVSSTAPSGTQTLTFGDAVSTSNSGPITQDAASVISNGGTGGTVALNVNMGGTSGNVILNGTNTYTGGTTITAGTLALGTTGSVANTSGFVLAAGAVFNTTAPGAYGMPTGKTFTISVDGTGSGSSGKIVAAGLDITNASVAFNVVNPLDDAAYVIASYSGLTGTAFAAVTPPAGYTINYAYAGGTQIALVPVSSDPFTPWIDNFGLTVGQKGKTIDPDNDGLNNITEFALDGNPNSGAANNKILSQTATITTGGTAKYLVLTLPVRNGVTGFTVSGGELVSNTVDGVTYHIQGSTDLSSWTQAVSEVTDTTAKAAIESNLPTATDSGWTYRTFSSPVPITATPKQFLRAVIEAQP